MFPGGTPGGHCKSLTIHHKMSGVWVGPSQDAEQPEFRRPKSCPIGAYRGVFTGDMAAVSDGRLAQDNGQTPRLISLYEARGGSPRRRRPWRWLAFEPLAELFLLGLLSDGIGQSSSNWLRLARGEKIPMPALRKQNEEEDQAPDLADRVPAPRHSLTITLRSSLIWPQDVRRTDR